MRSQAGNAGVTVGAGPGLSKEAWPRLRGLRQ